MTASAKTKGFIFVDLEDVFDAVAEKTFTDYCHLTPKGDEVIAERLYKAIAPALTSHLIEAAGTQVLPATRSLPN